MATTTVELRLSDVTADFEGQRAEDALAAVVAECHRRGLTVQTYIDRRTREYVYAVTGEMDRVRGLLPSA
jgi:hypothetical protein